MRGTWEWVRGGIVAAVCGSVLAGTAAGCAQTVPGTPYAEGQSPPAATAGTGESSASGTEPGASDPAPPSSFTVPGPLPSGRPTVTVQPVPEPTDPAPGPAAPAPTLLPAPDASGDSRRTVTPRRSRTAPATPGTASPVQGPPGPLTADVVPDECLLDAAGFSALLGTPVPAPANHVVKRSGGVTTRSCFAVASSGSPAPTAAVNVYRVNTGTPAAFLRTATGSRPFAGVGDGAVLVDTVGGPTLQIATPRHLVTIAVAENSPTEAQWRAAGRAAVARLAKG